MAGWYLNGPGTAGFVVPAGLTTLSSVTADVGNDRFLPAASHSRILMANGDPARMGANWSYKGHTLTGPAGAGDALGAALATAEATARVGAAVAEGGTLGGGVASTATVDVLAGSAFPAWSTDE